jgi:acyl transferase domain-containing protein
MGDRPIRDTDIAVIGLTGRFPEAPDVETLWRNLEEGKDCFREITDEDIASAGVWSYFAQHPAYVRRRPVLGDIKGFDAGLFGFSPREAAIADPQQRIFLECVHEVLEGAGYGVSKNRRAVGVFGGTNISSYLQDMMATNLMAVAEIDQFELMIGNDKDSLATMASYRLDLTGPAVSVQSYCSTSAVAMHLAIQSLRNGECELAVAGGICVRVPDRIGYVYVEGGQASPDGYIRTFDAQAGGSVFGDGCAMLLLKPLAQAMADRDPVHAVILGTGMNNDGASKFSYTAPSVEGQSGAIAAALSDADVDPRDVSYVEAHGTATILGDPIEVAALTRAYDVVARARIGQGLADRQYCAIGSVKTNVGHLDRAATATGVIKVIEALRHELIPKNLNFETPNPEINFPRTPFYVAADPIKWPRKTGSPRIAGVNGLGMGGTNVHLVVAEPPVHPTRRPMERRWQVLPLSARTEKAADVYCASMADHLAAQADADLADVAFTLQVGRAQHAHRRVVVADTSRAAAHAFTGHPADGAALLARHDGVRQRRVSFMFSGVGEHYAGMVADLYATEPTFARHLDDAQSRLSRVSDIDAVTPLTAARDQAATPDLAALMGRTSTPTEGPLSRTRVAQPAVFIAEYALAQTLGDWGLTPDLVVGYSVGEYVAACIAGVLTLDDAIRLVAHRAALIDRLPAGGMLAVAGTWQELEDRFPGLGDRGIDRSADTPGQVVVGGPADAIARLAEDLRAAMIACRALDTTHAFHTRMLATIANELTDWIAGNIRLSAPVTPYVSNVTGGLVTAEEVCDPGYWARHMTSPVDFTGCIETALSRTKGALVEIGPGKTLGAMFRSHPGCDRDRWPMLLSSVPAAGDRESSDRTTAGLLAELSVLGIEVDWDAYQRSQGDWTPGRVPLPTYPYQRQQYWFEGTSGQPAAEAAEDGDLEALSAEYDSLPLLPERLWLNVTTWRERAPRPPMADPGQRWVIFADGDESEDLVRGLRARLPEVELVVVRPAGTYTREEDGYRVEPGSIDDLVRMFVDLKKTVGTPDRVVHLWTLVEGDLDDIVRRGMHTLVGIARSALEVGFGTWALDVVTSGTFQLDDEPVSPAAATVHGPCTILPVEDPGGRIRVIDVVRGAAVPVEALVSELATDPGNQVLALRGGHRWTPDFDILELAEADAPEPELASSFREGGVYLVTGGLGGIGLALAERIVADHRGRVVMMGRTSVPDRQYWQQILDDPAAPPEARRRIEGLVHLEELGGEFLTVSGDVAVVADVRRAYEAAKERFGAVNGIIHAAGVPGMGMMQFKTSVDMDAVLAPKVAGTLALAEVIGDDPVDFMVLFSSVASWTGALGQADYSSANCFLDAFARSGALPQTRVVAIGWGEWTWNGWEDGLEGYEQVLRDYYTHHREQYGIGFDAGWRFLERIVGRSEPHVVVSTQDFAAQVAGSRSYSIKDIQSGAQRGRGGQRYPRPELSTPYLAPSTPEEAAIAEIWGEWLGVEEVGVMDNFFDLGGNSLTGVGVIEAIREELELDHLPAHTLYQAPTVSALAEQILGAAAADSVPAPQEVSLDRAQKRQQRRANRRVYEGEVVDE